MELVGFSRCSPLVLSTGQTVFVRPVTAWEAFLLRMLPVELLDHVLSERKKKEDADLVKSLRFDDAPDGPVDRTDDFYEFARQTIEYIEIEGEIKEARFSLYPAPDEHDLKALAGDDLINVRNAAFGFDWVNLVPISNHWMGILLFNAAAKCRQSPSQFLQKSLAELALDLAVVIPAGEGGA